MAKVEPGELAAASALRAAARASWRAGALPGAFAASVTDMRLEVQSYRRVAYRIERRDVVLRVAPAHGSKKSDLATIQHPGSIDPWAVDPGTLPGTSRALITCPSCAGTKRVTCPACAGGGRVRCFACGGGGRVQGARGPKNCPACRGRGDVKCDACSKGRIACAPCDALGRVHGWLEVVAEQSVQVRVHPRVGLAQLHAGVLDPADFDRVSAGSRVPLAQDSGWIEPIGDALGPDLAASMQPRTDRLVAQRIQRFESVVRVFDYATLVGRGTVFTGGTPPAVLPGSDWRPLRRRAIVAIGVGIALLLAGMTVNGHYLGRAEWFARHGNGGSITLLAIASAITGGFAAAGLLLRREARRGLRLLGPALAFFAAWLGIASAWVSNGPSPRSASELVRQGELAEARTELEAVRVVEGESAAYADALAELEIAEARHAEELRRKADEEHFARVEASKDAVSALAALRGEWHDPSVAARAREAMLDIAASEIEAAVSRKDVTALGQLAKLLEPVDERLGRIATRRARLARAAACIDEADFACASDALDGWVVEEADDGTNEAHAVLVATLVRDLEAAIVQADVEHEDLERRVGSIDEAIATAKMYEALANKPSPRPLAELDAARSKAVTRLEKERNAAALADQRRRKIEAQRERRAAQKRAQAEQRAARQADRVRCCDGSFSPTCRYSQGSLRGCCSHHRGVC